MKPIAVDAMGGDKAPAEIVAGARLAAAEGIPILLVGPADLADRGDLELLVATEVIGMSEVGKFGAQEERLDARAQRRSSA